MNNGGGYETFRILAAPPLGKEISFDSLAEVELVPVTASDSLGEQLVELYDCNPSPFVSGPTDLERLTELLNRDMRYYLVMNSVGQVVGARAFDPVSQMLLHTVTDYHHRGNGYQFGAGKKLMRHLAEEGFHEFRAAVYRSNTRIQRNMAAAGWEMESHPDNPGIVRGKIRVD